MLTVCETVYGKTIESYTGKLTGVYKLSYKVILKICEHRESVSPFFILTLLREKKLHSYFFFFFLLIEKNKKKEIDFKSKEYTVIEKLHLHVM